MRVLVCARACVCARVSQVHGGPAGSVSVRVHECACLCARACVRVHVCARACVCAGLCARACVCACLCARWPVGRFTAARLEEANGNVSVRWLVCARACVRVCLCAGSRRRGWRRPTATLVCARACVRAGLWAGSRRRGWRRPTATLVCAGLCVRVLVCAFACAQVHGGAAGGGQRQR